MFDLALEGQILRGKCLGHIRSTLVDPHPQLRLANMAECINTYRESGPKLPPTRASHRDWSRHNPLSQNFLQSTALAHSRLEAGFAACEHGKSSPAVEESHLLKQAEQILPRRLRAKSRQTQPFSCAPHDPTLITLRLTTKIPPLLLRA
jgi:hypothetical protein